MLLTLACRHSTPTISSDPSKPQFEILTGELKWKTGEHTTFRMLFSPPADQRPGQFLIEISKLGISLAIISYDGLNIYRKDNRTGALNCYQATHIPFMEREAGVKLTPRELIGLLTNQTELIKDTLEITQHYLTQFDLGERYALMVMKVSGQRALSLRINTWQYSGPPKNANPFRLGECVAPSP